MKPPDSLPRFPLATLPTPLQEAKRLRGALGGDRYCPRILIKRDDLTGLALGGNKARKLEFLVADALKADATVLVTSGATQSNHARMTAAAARAAGMKAALVLSSKIGSPPLQGNLLLDRLFDAEIHFVTPGPDKALAVTGDVEDRVAEVAADLRQRGERPYVIPNGGSSPIGALGYVTATAELLKQLSTSGVMPSWLYYASGSRGTAAGLVLGARLFEAGYRLRGIAVSGGEPEKTMRSIRVATEASDLLGQHLQFGQQDFLTDQDYIGDGYGLATPGCQEAIKLMARAEGILLDPVYTGKAMAGLIDHIRRQLILPSETVIFLHTGGTPALFALGDQLAIDSD